MPSSLPYNAYMDWSEENLELLKTFDLINLDELFVQSPGARIVNNETLVSQNLSKDFTTAIYQNSDGDIGFVPTCKCGYIRGVTKVGMICPQCDTVCDPEFMDVLTHTAWVGIPDSMAPVLHPIWYLILNKWSSVSRRDISAIDIILNPTEDIPDDLVPFIKGRGFWYFYENIDEILHMLVHDYPRTAKKAETAWIVEFIKKYKKIMFTRHLPILHNSLHPLKKNGSTLNFTDNISKEILEAIINLSSETFKQHATNTSTKQFNRTVFDIYQKIISYYKGIVKEKLGGKQAILRKHDFGSRVHCSFRSVIVPNNFPMPMDTVVPPWGVMVCTFKLPILNIFISRFHMNFSEAMRIYLNALVKYDERVDKVLEMLRDESPDQRFALLVGRNPTLAVGSMMQLYCTEWDKDPDNETMKINACISGPPNFDFDGCA